MVPRLRIAPALLALALSGAAAAQTVDLNFGADGQYAVWLAEANSWEAPKDESTFTGKRGSFTIPEGDKRVLNVAHLGKNLLALRPAADFAKSSSWTLKDTDWTRVHEVRVQPERGIDGLLTANCGGEVRTQLVSRLDESVSFWGLKRSELSMTAEARVDGETQTTGKVVFSLKDPPPADEALAVRIPAEWAGAEPAEPAEPAGEGAVAKSDADSKPAGAEGPSILSTILNLLIAVVLIGGVGYGVWMYFRKNPGQAKEMLAQAGIQDPGAAPPDDLPPTPEPTQKPLERIILDGAAPEPSAPLAAAPIAAANPRLVRPDGSLFLIPEGEATVGREGDHGWTLTGESSVSRLHARLRRQGSEVWISDAGSTNGVWVNGAKIDTETPLRVGDGVMIGAVQARFEA